MMSDPSWYEVFFGEDYLRMYVPKLPPEWTEREVDGIATILERGDLSTGLAMHARQHVTRNFPVHRFISRFEAIYTETAARPLRSVREQLVPLSSETS